MRVVMTLFVRDEADIIGELVRSHLDQGVHAFAVIDNGSTDRTTEILRRRDLAEHVHLT
jgi:glycosyltransferase involved in cell wall biosynthesis